MNFIISLLQRRNRYVRVANLKVSIQKNIIILLSLFVLHVCAMQVFEGLDLWQSIWLTLTTITTVGYGDVSASTFYGQLSTIFCLYFGAIFFFASVFTDLGEYRRQKHELQRTGLWEWNMKNHILVVGLPINAPERYLELFSEELRLYPEFNGKDVMILAKSLPYEDGKLPEKIANRGFFFLKGSGSDSDDLVKAHIDKASHVVVLCPDESLAEADDITAAIVYRITDELASEAIVVAESASDSKRAFISKNGASEVVRASNDYPAILLKALAVPGSQHIVEDFFQQGGGNQLTHCYCDVESMSWKELSVRLIQNDIGIFMGYKCADGNIYRNGTEQVENAEVLFVLSSTGAVSTDKLAEVLI